MLQTCTRCRSRRIKCDSLLPACNNCAKSDQECTFHDDALQEDIPRSYVKALRDRIDDLESQLMLIPSQLPRVSGQGDVAYSLPSASFVTSTFIMPGPGQDLYLDLSVPSRVARVTCEILSLPEAMPDISSAYDEDIAMTDFSRLDRSILTPRSVRFLLSRFERSIKPKYDLLNPELFTYDGIGLRKLPDSQKFQLLMACAIAAIQESYKSPNWKILAEICRNWANELMAPILSAADGESLTAFLLLLIYELSDPNRGVVWELIDLAMRTCLQLGWHRTAHSITYPLHNVLGDHSSQKESDSKQREARMIYILKDIESSLRTIFNRPNMLGGLLSPEMSASEIILDTYTQLFQTIYGHDQIYDPRDCPYADALGGLMELIEKMQFDNPLVWELWLLFLPVCAKHRQCVSCFQEVDEETGRGMRTLRRRVLEAASLLVRSIYRAATGTEDFISPFVASVKGFVAGCSIVTGLSKRWNISSSYSKDLIKCTEILTMFAPHWKGGQSYLNVWRTVVDHLDINGAQIA